MAKLSGLKHRFHPLFVLWLTIMWCLLMGEVSVANIVGGILVGLAVTMALPLPAMPLSGLDISWGLLARFILVWIGEFFQASVKVAWLALRPAAPPKTAILTVPMRVDSEFVLALSVMLYNLQPGGAVTDIDIASRQLTVHILDADNPQAIARELAAIARLEKSMIHIFERTV
ncbi:Na+/H+ antiporter subunit E [Corynebacterium lizhenjunii]|uniref:Na+/H+ antiporter subunit E n=1 Tax=Corynebacterium lizhenjunii TaxID=2709394 RepID=A0A7T0KE49_9CORY|nr:Na+/H+ antiporter subunit E [Corynebacterium lizhenjunii]QPK78922.1 Na+/H+ antiporter subunit E [Corynebacterium lizhenjunii]